MPLLAGGSIFYLDFLRNFLYNKRLSFCPYIIKRKVFLRYCQIISGIIILCMPVYVCADIINPGFEQKIIDEGLDFDPPFGWDRENYAAIVNSFIPEPESGNASNWKIDLQTGLQPFEGESFVVLSSGNMRPAQPKTAKISQMVDIEAGQTIMGTYFFGTCDYVDFIDYATIIIEPNFVTEPNSITLVSIDVTDVGSYGSMDAWGFFEYTFGDNQTGYYELTIQVSDMGDLAFESYIAVDNLRLCNVPVSVDLNRDCEVNLLDFSWLSNDCMLNCSDPNTYSDPNQFCPYGTDIDGNGHVGPTDLNLMAQSWLHGG